MSLFFTFAGKYRMVAEEFSLRVVLHAARVNQQLKN